MSFVLIDAGNSCLKISILDDLINSELLYDVIDYECLQEGLIDLLHDVNPSKVLVSNVNSATIFYILSDIFYKLWRIEVSLLIVQQDSYQISTKYINPRTLGCDRWSAMIASRHEFKGPFCIIDCGTAVTIDVVSDSGMHLGGLITPGLKTSRKSLGLNTSALPSVENIEENDQNNSSFFATNTQDAILGGTLYQLSAYIERIVSEIKEEFGENIDLIITGGDADKIQALTYHYFHHRETLVLDGLRIVAQDIFKKETI